MRSKGFQYALVFLGLVTLFLSHRAHAGPGSSGGGTGIFCPAPMKAVQLLDLYEGKIMERYTYTESNDDYETQLQKMVWHLSVDFTVQYPVSDALDTLMTRAIFLPKGVSINVPGDINDDGLVVKPTGCELGGIGYYEGEQLYISSDAFDAMSETDKAAFFMHEAIYAVYRERQFYSSNPKITPRPTRKVVANLFADQRSQDELRKRTRVLSWDLGEKSKVGNWSVVKGSEDRIAYAGKRTGVLVDNALPTFSVTAWSNSKVPATIYLQCVSKTGDGDGSKWPVWSEYLKSTDQKKTLSVELPGDCLYLIAQVRAWEDGDLHYSVNADGYNIIEGARESTQLTEAFFTYFEIHQKR